MVNQNSKKQTPLEHVRWIAEQFKLPVSVKNITKLNFGNVNESFVLHQKSADKKFVIQQINSYVFPYPKKIIENLRVISDHIDNRLASSNIFDGKRWEIIRLVCTKDGADYFTDYDKTLWRVFNFIDNATCFNNVNDTLHAKEIGKAIGRFHFLVSDLATEKLHDTLPGFHIIPEYLAFYDSVLDDCNNLDHTDETTYCRRFIEDRREQGSLLENEKKTGKLTSQVIHGDPKISNVMIDDQSAKSIAVLDLDTVKPGLIHYDIGDSLRSACNILGEETSSYNKIFFDTNLCRHLLKGYLQEAVHFLTNNDYEYIYDSIRLITYELGLRFFTDYLAGDKYFKIVRHGQNLSRALVQFRLVESIEQQENSIRRLVTEMRQG